MGGYKLPFLAVGGTLMVFVPMLHLLIPSTRIALYNCYCFDIIFISIIAGKKQYIPPKTLMKLLCDVPFLLLGNSSSCINN